MNLPTTFSRLWILLASILLSCSGGNSGNNRVNDDEIMISKIDGILSLFDTKALAEEIIQDHFYGDLSAILHYNDSTKFFGAWGEKIYSLKKLSSPRVSENLNNPRALDGTTLTREDMVPEMNVYDHETLDRDARSEDGLERFLLPRIFKSIRSWMAQPARVDIVCRNIALPFAKKVSSHNPKTAGSFIKALERMIEAKPHYETVKPLLRQGNSVTSIEKWFDIFGKDLAPEGSDSIKITALGKTYNTVKSRWGDDIITLRADEPIYVKELPDKIEIIYLDEGWHELQNLPGNWKDLAEEFVRADKSKEDLFSNFHGKVSFYDRRQREGGDALVDAYYRCFKYLKENI